MKTRLAYGFNDPNHAIFCNLTNIIMINGTEVWQAVDDNGNMIQAPAKMFKII